MAAPVGVTGRPGLSHWLLLAGLLIVADQATKAWIVHVYAWGEGTVVTSFFNLVRVHNTGAAFSFLASAAGWQRWFFTAFGLVASAVIVWLLHRHGQQRLFATALTLILGGALGNVIDRLWHGHVIDFLQFHWAGWYFPSFNVADSAITVGAGLLILDELRRWRASR